MERDTGLEEEWSMPGVFRIDGLSALGLKSCCCLPVGILGFWLASVVTARAEKKVATCSPAGGAGGAPYALPAFGPWRFCWGFGV